MAKQLNETAELPDAVVNTNEDGDIIGTGNDARIAMLERINDQNDSQNSDQYADVNDDGTTTPFVVAQPDGEQEPLVDEAVHEEIVDHDAEPEPEPPAKFKIKINGKELELTQEELIARAQKVEAADQYLAEAARLRKEAESARTQPPPQDAAARAEEEERQLVRAIQMGSEEEAMAAIRKLKSSGPSLTGDDIARTVDERLTFKEAANRFATEYEDLMKDDVLRKMVLQRDQELLAAGDTRPYIDRYTEIGNEVRAWRDRLVKSSVPAQSTSKQERKAGVPSVPKAASVRAPAPVDEDDRDESVADVIATIAKARGGPQWTRA